MSVIMPNCPFQTADRRLDEAHHTWHQCLSFYHDPAGFRINLNACIQALRNVTFTLQKQRSQVAGFDEWYSPWQETLKGDAPIMPWIVRSRNRIVKEDDLETRSYLRGMISVDYDDAAQRVIDNLRPRTASNRPKDRYTREKRLPPRLSMAAASRAASTGLPPGLLRHSSLVLERRWVDNKLPDWELLTALAYAYSRLGDLLADGHGRFDIVHDVAVREGNSVFVLSTQDERFARPQCMATTRDNRTIEIDLSDSKVVPESVTVRRRLSPDEREQSLEVLGPRPAEPENPTSAIDWIDHFFEMGKRVIEFSREEHQFWINFFRGGKIEAVRMVIFSDRTHKRRVAQQFAELCDMNVYDGILCIGEVWVSESGNYDEDGVLIHGEDDPNRRDALMVQAECADGTRAGRMLRFERSEEMKIMWHKDTQNPSEAPFNFFSPVRAVWRSWLE